MAGFRVVATLVGVFASMVIALQLFYGVHEAERRQQQVLDSVDDHGTPRQVSYGDDVFMLGVGKADITGPVVELNLMGYADLAQSGTGLRQRIYSRAFIVANPENLDDTWIYIVLDAHSGDTAIRHGILEALASLGGEYSRYGPHNVALTGTHSHAGPGAWLNYLLPQVTSLGFSKESYQAIVDGAILSIKRAHESLAPGRLSFGSIDVQGANINRSPYSYLANPEEERLRYNSDVDKTLTMMKFDRLDDKKTIGVLTFFSVHGTSLYGNNTLVAGDNKGVASYLFERSVKDDDRFTSTFVAGFSQASVGDTSPNVLGAYCEDTGEPCKFEDSTCGGKTTGCHGRGPFWEENDQGTKSCFEIGRRQFAAAKELYEMLDKVPTNIRGSSAVKSFHTFKDLSQFTFRDPFNSSREVSTCAAALGFSFAGGTTDGPGLFDFTQNGTDGPSQSNPLWFLVRGLLHAPSRKQKACHHPKTILLDVGEMDQPYPWSPNIVDMQLLRAGQLIIIVSASEITTMAGRRWKEAVARSAEEQLGITEPIVVLGAPANSYVHYMTTEEEYGVQRYEGGSTLHGPHTLAAHVNVTLTYLPVLSNESDPESLPPAGPSPPINIDKALSFISPVIRDGTPIGKAFGDVVSSHEEGATFRPGDTVSTTFIGANPRNNFRLESTFAAVEYQRPGSTEWEQVRSDADWNLVYRWDRKSTILGTSEVTIEWLIEDDYYSVGNPRMVENGKYRLRYYGDAKQLNGKITAFEGIGPTFNIEV
ncbi:hypothetical protein VTO42DRAFT_6987 [Malbranchea cinnamomea]